jgi:hypothetical protein
VRSAVMCEERRLWLSIHGSSLCAQWPNRG